LQFDEMAIKAGLSYENVKYEVDGLEDLGLAIGTRGSFTTSTLLFMAREGNRKRKQHFGYVLSSGNLKSSTLALLITAAIDALISVGLRQRVVVCDQGTNNQSAMRSLGVERQKSFFLHNDQKIILVFDLPYLIKNVRNNLRNPALLWTVDLFYGLKFGIFIPRMPILILECAPSPLKSI